jgi:antibiotic biosynthesis monooxygenase (ABM) superfamily enzyme
MSDGTHAQRRWKSGLVTFSVVFPTVEVLSRFLAPRVDRALQPVVTSDLFRSLCRDIVVVATMCVVLSYAIPVVSKPLRRWLSS